MSKKDDTKEIKQQAWTYYKVSSSGISRLKKECPRCKASFLAEHKDRRTCGKCGYTEFKSSKSTKTKA